MITPRFSCSQTESSVIVSMYCPSIRATDVDINVDDTLFTVHANPYFLRLNFPKPVVEDDDSSAQYDPSSGYLTVTLTKACKGEAFDDLDLLAKLLAPRRTPRTTGPSIEVLSDTRNRNGVDELTSRTENLTLENHEFDEAAECDWQLPQKVPDTLPPLRTSLQACYGFLDMYSGYLRHATHTDNEVNELGDDAEVCTKEERRSRRTEHEDQKFDEEHYMADFMDDVPIQEVLSWSHPYIADPESVRYTDKENLEILSLPRREYLATPSQTHNLYLTLITLLFAYAYDSRTTQHDPTSESAWTICNLIPAFSALDPPQSESYHDGSHSFSNGELQVTMVPSYRRVLTFPLYRSLSLAEKCREDVALLLQKGKRTITRCLLEMKQILDHHEVYYIYSKIWVNDFCTWIQADADDGDLSRLGESLMVLKVDKSSIGFQLRQLESLALNADDTGSDSDDEDEDEE